MNIYPLQTIKDLKTEYIDSFSIIDSETFDLVHVHLCKMKH